MNWTPISDKKLRDEIKCKIQDIYSALIKKESEFKAPGLFSGESGICLFYAYYSKENSIDIDLTVFINDIIDMADKVFSKPLTNFTDLTILSEIGWMVQHLSHSGLINIDSEEYFRDLDENLSESLLFFINNNRYDCLHGAINIGIYFYDRYLYGNNQKCYTYLEDFVEKLATKKIEDGNLIKWLSAIDYKNSTLGYNFGIAHGIPGLILFFVKLYNIGIKKELLTHLIIGSSMYLLSHKRELGKYKSYFPGIYLPQEYKESGSNLDNDHETRLGWCYGDLSVGYALYKAASLDLYNMEFIKTEALNILKQTTERKSPMDMAIFDACLCHGAGGIAHIYNRLYSLTDIKEFREAATYWLDITLKMSNNDSEFAGYIADLYNNEQKEVGNLKNRSLLTGISGIGLFFLSIISQDQPAWDECLLLS